MTVVSHILETVRCHY